MSDFPYTLHLTWWGELFFIISTFIFELLNILGFNGIVSDSTYITSHWRLGNRAPCKVLSGPSCDFTAQVSPNDYCAVSGMYLPRGPTEERNKTDNNVYWTSNQSASVSLADTVLPLWDSKCALPWAPNLCSDNHLPSTCRLVVVLRGNNTNTVVVQLLGIVRMCWALSTCVVIHCCILRYRHVI